MFVLYSCGCQGIRMKDHNIVLNACDADLDDPPFCFNERKGLSEKPAEPLPPEDVKTLIDGIGSLLHDGHHFRTIKRLLK